MKLQEIKHEWVEQIPDELQEGILYISDKYHTAIHLCACGCKQKVVTPFGGSENIKKWQLYRTYDKITLTPSIGNFSGENPYHAHYFITNDKIVWA